MEQENERPLLRKVKEESRTYTFSVKQLLIAALCVLGIIVLLFIWKTIQANSLKKESRLYTIHIALLSTDSFN